MMRFGRMMAGFLAAALLLPGCRKEEPREWEKLDEETRTERFYVNLFAFNVMDTYYLWRDEVASALEAWENWEEPVEKVAEVRYKDAAGKDIDRWTFLTDDFASTQGSVSGHTRTLGMDFQLYYVDQTKTRICAVVTYTYAGSPAEKAGIGRGEAILSVDGQELTPDNYRNLVREGLLGGGTVTLGLSSGRSVTLAAVDMYENPVQTALILERTDGKRTGYLHYTSFTKDSCEELVSVFRSFTEAGIGDLVLDLRYNGGGFVDAEQVLGSLLVPLKEVEAESVFSRSICNEKLSASSPDKPVCFQDEFFFKSGGELKAISAVGANPDLPRICVLVSGSSASASESLICGLKPYMDVLVVGQRTAGKYCGGYLIEASNWFKSVKTALGKEEYEKALPYVDNWGIYVMYSRYADCNGVTLSMPDGIAPDVEVKDNPLDGYALGDPRETMLSAALTLLEGRTRSVGEAGRPPLAPVPEDFHPRSSGLRVQVF